MNPYDDNEQFDRYGSNNSGATGEPIGWEGTGSTYHYSYVQPTPPAPQRAKKKKGGGAGRAVALVLSCALLGGGAGVGGAALFNHFAGPAGQEQGTTIYRNETNPAPVNVQKADGLKQMSLSEIYASYVDSCVCIAVQVPVTNGYYYGQQTRMATAAGSGFIISEDGYVVTNYHVIDGGTAIKVTLNNGEVYDAKLVGGEELNDVALLKIEGVTGLKPVVLGDSDDLVVGETVCTIGNALGSYSFSQTSGAVSATGRSVTMNDGTVMNMIQTDCTINSGNSGGPLFDSYGRVVGITSAKLSNNGDTSQASIEGIGFAIPLNDVKNIITDFIQYGHVTGRPSMGIRGADVTEEYRQTFGWPSGVYVNSVDEGSCAEKAGLRQGDIITKLGDTEVSSMNELASAKNRHRAGDTVTLTVWRQGEELTMSITFDEQEAVAQEDPTQNQPQDPSGQQGGSGFGYDYGGGAFDPWDFFNWNW